MFRYVTLMVTFLIAPANSVTFQIDNNDTRIVWIGIQAKPGYRQLENGGFVLGSKQTTSTNVDGEWGGRIWARTWCDNETRHCATGDCGNKIQCGGAGGTPPATLIEITLKGPGGNDYYDLSLVDGFNTFATIEPIGGQGDGGKYSCKKVQCVYPINNDCPNELKLNTAHGTVGCKSACVAFNTDQYCCRGAHNRLETCRSSDWPQDYPKFFKDRCPDAYSYVFDEQKSTYTCKNVNTYVITFGG